MRVAVNTRLLIENELEGIGRFTYEILKELCNQNPNIYFDFIFDKPFSKKFLFNKNVTGHVLRPRTRHPILWYYWFEVKIPKLLNKIKPDIFLSMDGFLSLRTNIKQIAVIHDINFVHHPSNLPFFHRKYYQKFFPKYAYKANSIITVSNYSKKDIEKNYSINQDKINVIYNGVSNSFKQIDEKKKQIMKNKYSSNFDYFIFIGSIHKRKNITNLITAFNIFKSNSNSETKLLFVGKKRWWGRKMKQIYQDSSYKNDILFTGYLKDEDLPMVLASAKGLCFPSLFEGFGLPIIEAMKCGVPVITSNTSSMPEICGEAGLKINPYEVNDIANALKKIDEEKDVREKLIKLGLERAQMFCWKKGAKKLTKILNL